MNCGCGDLISTRFSQLKMRDNKHVSLASKQTLCHGVTCPLSSFCASSLPLLHMQQSTEKAGRRSPIMESDGAEQEGGRSRKRKGSRRKAIKIPPREMRFSMWGSVGRGKEKSFFAPPSPPAPVAAAAATPPRSHHAQRAPPRSGAAAAALKAVTVPVTACKEGGRGNKKVVSE